jgi:hypothetical protein
MKKKEIKIEKRKIMRGKYYDILFAFFLYILYVGVIYVL